MVGRTTRPTASQRRRMDALSKMPCIASVLLGFKQPFKTEVHHITSGGRRLGHDFTIPLNSWTHRGVLKSGYTQVSMTLAYGPSLALSKRAFVAHYGTELELLEIVNKKLTETE